MLFNMKNIFWNILTFIGCCAIACLIFGLVQISWNYVMPYIFGLPEIGFWHVGNMYLLIRLFRLFWKTNFKFF